MVRSEKSYQSYDTEGTDDAPEDDDALAGSTGALAYITVEVLTD